MGPERRQKTKDDKKKDGEERKGKANGKELKEKE